MRATPCCNNDPKLGYPVFDPKGKVWVAEMPGGRPDQAGGRVLGIEKSSKVKEAAYKVLTFFADPERTSKIVYNNTTWLDPYRKSHASLAIATALVGKENEANARQFILSILQSNRDGYPILNIRGSGKYHEALERIVRKAVAGQLTAEEAAKQATKEFDEITDQLGRERQLKEWQDYVDTVLKPKGLWNEWVEPRIGS